MYPSLSISIPVILGDLKMYLEFLSTASPFERIASWLYLGIALTLLVLQLWLWARLIRFDYRLEDEYLDVATSEALKKIWKSCSAESVRYFCGLVLAIAGAIVFYATKYDPGMTVLTGVIIVLALIRMQWTVERVIRPARRKQLLRLRDLPIKW